MQIHRRDLFSLVLILIVAALLRLGAPGITEFFHDEAILSMKALDMARGENFPLTGIVSSVGIPNPPTSVYVVAIPYLFTDHPLAATLFIAALNVAGVGLLWLITYRTFDRTTALIAGLAYAVSPWAVLYSRKIWAQDFHTPLILLALFLGLEGFVRGRKWGQVLCLPVLLFALQIHFAAWALLPLYVVLVWMGRERLSRPALVLSVGLSALVLLPYAVGLAQTLTADPDRLNTSLDRTTVRDGLGLSLDSLRYTAYLTTGLGIETWVAPLDQTPLRESVPAVLWGLIGAAALFGIVPLWRRYRTYALLVLLWAFFPALVFLPTWTKVYPHYFIASIPALLLLAGLAVSSIKLPQRAYRTLILLAFAALLITQGVWWWRMLGYVDRTEIALGEGTSGFTTPLHYLLPVRETVRGFDDVVVVSDGMWTDFDVEAARWVVMLRDSARCVRTLPGDGLAVFPAGRFAAIIAPNAPLNAVDRLYHRTSTPEAVSVFPTRSENHAYIVNRFESAPQWDVVFNPVEPVRFVNGVTLTGYALTENRVFLEWSLAGQGDDYQYFVHLLDANGGVIQQRDASFWAGRHWCAGDRLVTWQDVDTVENTAMIRAGFYALDGEQITAVDVLDAMGNAAGNWVDIEHK